MSRTPRTCHELGVCHGRKGPGCTCQHDTDALPPGGYYFAPGAIEHGPRRKADQARNRQQGDGLQH